MNKIRALLAGVAVLGAFLLPTAASAATAHTAAPAAHALTVQQANKVLKGSGLVLVGKVHGTDPSLCLAIETSDCWQAEGSGAQIHMTTNSNSSWTVLTESGTGVVKFQDGNGKCAYMDTGSGHALMLGSNGCSGSYDSSSTQSFTQSGSNPYIWQSDYNGSGGGGLIMAFNTGSDKPIWVNNQTGDVRWDAI